MKVIVLALLVFCLAGSTAGAVEPDEMLKEPALELRARNISRELRCLVCQNQSIDESNAELARDLRLLVRERLTAGDSDAAVLAFVQARYGEFVLLRPRLEPQTLLLWLTPILLLAGAGYYLLRARRGAAAGSPAPPSPLTAAERQRLDGLLAEDRPPSRSIT